MREKERKKEGALKGRVRLKEKGERESDEDR